MMNIEFRDGLLFTSIGVTYKGNSKMIDNVVIDTGAAETIISTDVVDDIGMYAELGDKIITFYGVGGSQHTSFAKVVDKIKLGDKELDNLKIDFGIIDNYGEINGLIGLDILMKLEIVIDLKNLVIRTDV